MNPGKRKCQWWHRVSVRLGSERDRMWLQGERKKEREKQTDKFQKVSARIR